VSLARSHGVRAPQVITALATNGYFSVTLGGWRDESLPIHANTLGGGWETSSARVSTADAVADALTYTAGTGILDVHVTRSSVTVNGTSGVAWAVTFISPTGNLPVLRVNSTNVTFGTVTVSELLHGQANQFTIEPKKASGSSAPALHCRRNNGVRRHASERLDCGVALRRCLSD
jgi:hypothetical protein